jgi:tetratricopeptide (TPR) repeat protein
MSPKLTLPQTVRENARPVKNAALVLEAALEAHRAGTLDHLLIDRPGAARWITHVFLQPILGAAGDALPADHAPATALQWLLEWALTQARPDRAHALQLDDRAAWLDRPAWRPFIAAMCHYGFAPVPDFKDRYYRRPDESPADSLCGLWNIGASTFYRHLEKARRMMARALFEQRLDQRHSSALREHTRAQVYRRLHLATRSEQEAWHRRQTHLQAQQHDFFSAAWHARHARETTLACEIIERHAGSIAASPEIIALLDALRADAPAHAEEVKVLLARAHVFGARGDMEAEREACNQALGRAAAAGDDLLTGIAYARLGKFHEPRDADRALSCYQSSVECLQRAAAAGGVHSPAAQDEFVATLVKLAWLYVLRNDPRARAILDHAGAMRDNRHVSDLSAALLEQCWGEYWRRAGDMKRALEHQHRALNLYERNDDHAGLAKAYINLGLTYSDLRSLDRAIAYLHKAIDLAQTVSVGAEAVASAHLNLGACYFWRMEYQQAIHYYRVALAESERERLALSQARAHHNLAEAHYMLLAQTGRAHDEQAGDEHAAAAIALYRACDQPSYVDAVQRMKAERQHGQPEPAMDRLLPEESASNYAEATIISEYRKALMLPALPETHIRAHLAIAQAYLAISTKEREAAVALMEQHGLADQFAGALQQLHDTFNLALTREARLEAQWQQAAGDLLDAGNRAQVLTHLAQAHALSKSSYAGLCHVSLATASKHLGALAGRGLLVQTGKGPATKYVLPEDGRH